MQRLTVFATLLLIGVAHAQDPCAADVVQFCSKVEPGAGRVVRCLEEHEIGLSGSCKEKLAADAQSTKVLIAEFSDACLGDVEALCPGVSPGGGRLLNCLTRNDYAVSPRCLAELTKFDVAREKVVALRTQCQADVKRLCPATSSNAGDILTCLRANEAELSSGCRSANPATAIEAASLVDTVDEMTSQARIEDTIAIL